MGALKSTLVSAVLLIVLAAAVGMAVNPFRGRSRIDLQRDYSPPRRQPNPTTVPTTQKPEDQPIPPGPGADPPTTTAATKPTTTHVQEEFQELTFEEVAALHADPLAEAKIYLFLDARNDDHYEAGHIPGALQCDYWRNDLPNVIDRALAAEKIVVYCNGGTCEDSLMVCRQLVMSGVPQTNVYLYAHGWEEWSQRSTEIERGRP